MITSSRYPAEYLLSRASRFVAHRKINDLKSFMDGAAAEYRGVRRGNEIEIIEPVVYKLGAAKSHDQALIRLVQAEPAEMQVGSGLAASMRTSASLVAACGCFG